MRDLHDAADGLTVRPEDLRQERDPARDRIRGCGLPRMFAEVDAGRYGTTRTALDLLEAVEQALALCVEVGKQLAAHLTMPEEKGFQPRRPLAEDEAAFVRLFAAFVACTDAAAVTAELTDGSVRAENSFDLTEVRRLLTGPSADPARDLLTDLTGYVRFHQQHAQPALRVDGAGPLANCVHAYFVLMANTIRILAADAAYAHLRRALQGARIEILGRTYEGFSHRACAEPTPSGLLDVSTDDIVGNADYLRACRRTARDVAGFDFAAGRNPKTINPVLFAHGRPGCGKTVTAHAVGHYFLDYCAGRNVPARFLVIRRTDWASSYQNASANALVRIFQEQVTAASGVVGLYWPDIDTAFAAREDPGIRAEERNILGACFGVFDGTLLPKNGKWFMMCDANHMTMDEATISRITQDPHVLEGAKTPEDRVRLLRDIKLRDNAAHLSLSLVVWASVGARLTELDLSGRSIENIARRIIAEMEDFEYPDEYFTADFEERQAILRRNARMIDAAALGAVLERHAEFERSSEALAEKDRFDRRIEEIVFNLSAREEALDRYGNRPKHRPPETNP